jgi:hypothetical protein
LLPSFWGLEGVGGKNTAPEEVVPVVVFWVPVVVVVALVPEMEVLAPAEVVLVVDPAAGEGLSGKWATTNCWFGAPWDTVPGCGLLDFLAGFFEFLFYSLLVPVLCPHSVIIYEYIAIVIIQYNITIYNNNTYINKY